MAGKANFYLTVDFNFIPQVVANVEMASRGAPLKIAKEIQRTAKQLAPHRTGHLKSTIEVQSLERGKTAEVFAWAKYAAWQEYGTSRGIVAKYYMTRAFQRHAQELNGAIIGAIVPW